MLLSIKYITIDTYHHYLIYSDTLRMHKIMHTVLTWPNMLKDVEKFIKNCLCYIAAKSIGLSQEKLESKD